MPGVKILGAASAVIAMAFGLTSVRADSYPNKPVRIIVTIAAGSVTDVIMRAAAQKLSTSLKQQFVIENRAGASGIVGAQACASSTPDGYTLCTVYHNTMSLNPYLFDKLPYNPDSDFEPITSLFYVTEVLAVTASSPARTLNDLKKEVATNPKAFNWGTLGAGSYPELFLKWINHQWRSEIVAVPYQGGGPIAQAIAANEIQLGSMGIGNFLGAIQSGQVRPLAVSTQSRSPILPDVPTFAEAGLSGYPGRAWWGIAAPKGTPKEIVEKLNNEIVMLFKEPSFVKFLESQAVEPNVGSTAEFLAFLKKDREAAKELIQIAQTPRSTFKPQ